MKVAVRVRSGIGMKPDARKTLESLKLKTVNNCIIVNEKKIHSNMLQKVKDYITWGEIEKETLKKVLLKWARTLKGKKLDEQYFKEIKMSIDDIVDKLFKDEVSMKDLGLKVPIRLHPPRKGYEGIKRPFTMKGALGYRGKAMDELIKRMI
ncbi:50S ribosomal protein L30 [Candidatus Micrarchaeota archaeon]|nr:MAG: 50S ribosomal protein L30 [Candidatus Micrarchaeota archaeon]